MPWPDDRGGRCKMPCHRRRRLTLLDLCHNQLSGGIPPELGQLGNLLALALSYNRLSGEIPVQFNQLVVLDSRQRLDSRDTKKYKIQPGVIIMTRWWWWGVQKRHRGRQTLPTQKMMTFSAGVGGCAWTSTLYTNKLLHQKTLTQKTFTLTKDDSIQRAFTPNIFYTKDFWTFDEPTYVLSALRLPRHYW